MPRRPRIHLAGCRYTVSSVATTAIPISIGEEDSLAYPHGLGEALKTYHRTGTLWDSCYTSSLVQADTY